MVRRFAILVGICALAGLALAPSAGAMKLKRLTAPVSTCSGQNDAGAPAYKQEAAMRCMINYARNRSKRGDFNDAGKLDDSAGNKARDIVNCQDFSHEACGRNFLFWFDQLNYTAGGCWRAGENIAWGSGEYSTVRSILRAWLRSPGHRANMLSGSYDQFGVGMQVGDLNGYGNAHVWVTHFGDHC